MKIVLLLVCALALSNCASPDDEAQAKLGPTIKEQRKEAKEREEFAKALPPPR